MKRKAIRECYKMFKELRAYYKMIRYCHWGGPANKADWIIENRIEPIAREHLILDVFARIP